MKNKRDKIINRFSLGHKILCAPSVKRMKNKNVGFNILETFPELTHSLKNERELSWDNKEILPGDLKNQEPVSAADFSIGWFPLISQQHPPLCPRLGARIAAEGRDFWTFSKVSFCRQQNHHSHPHKSTYGQTIPSPPTSSLQPPSNEYFSIDTNHARFLRHWAAAGVCVQGHWH